MGVKDFIIDHLPVGWHEPLRRVVRRFRRKRTQLQQWPPIGAIRFGHLRRLEPFSQFGKTRGTAIDRHYIEEFLARHADDVHGRVLEVGGRAYTRQFGGDRVTRSDVLHVAEGFPDTTIVADLTRADHVPDGSFDCIILTQTLQFIYDVQAAVRTLHRILAPDGVVLATMAGISQISRFDMDRWGESWRFTSKSAHRLFADVFAERNVSVETTGNVLVATAFLYGLAAEELRAVERDHIDPNYEFLITVRARKETT